MENFCHIMVFEGYWIHSLGMLRLLLGREMGTRVYLEMDVSVIDTSYSMMFNRHFLNFDHLGICLSYYDHNSNPVDLIQKFFEFETQCGILLLNEACEYCFSDEKISQQVGEIGSYCGKRSMRSWRSSVPGGLLAAVSELSTWPNTIWKLFRSWRNSTAAF